MHGRRYQASVNEMLFFLFKSMFVGVISAGQPWANRIRLSHNHCSNAAHFVVVGYSRQRRRMRIH
jgi:hypothetical protein